MFRTKLYVPVTVNREQSVKRDYQQDATNQLFIVNFRCLLSTVVSTCFGHHYAHHQENKDRVLLHMVFALVVLVAVVGRCVVGCEHCEGYCSDQLCRENENTHFMLSNIFPKIVPFM